jgi:hypothetical protein
MSPGSLQPTLAGAFYSALGSIKLNFSRLTKLSRSRCGRGSARTGVGLRLSRHFGAGRVIRVGVARDAKCEMTPMYEGASLPARMLRTAEAGRFLGLSGRTLEKHRTFGTGPTYRKIGGRVVYAIDDLQAWADRGAQTSTTDPHRNRISPARRISDQASSAA